MKTHVPKVHARLNLSARDLATLEGLCNDGFQSIRARKRAHALLLMSAGTPVESVLFRTGLAAKSMEGMMERLKSHGVHGAIFDKPHQHKAGQHDPSLLAEKARRILSSRPPPGMLRWSLEALTEAIRCQLTPGATLNREMVRQILKKNLGIKSIRFVEPYWYQQMKKHA